MKKSEQDLSFEEALSGLERITSELQSGKLTLEEAVTAYESGLKLKSYAQKKLNDAQLRLRMANDPEDLLELEEVIQTESNTLMSELAKCIGEYDNAKVALNEYSEKVMTAFTRVTRKEKNETA